MRERLLAFLHIATRPHYALGGAFVIGTALVGYAWYSTSVTPSGTYTTASVGTLTEEVDVSGLVKAAHASDLSFQVSGQVAAVNVAVGDHVAAGQVLVALSGAAQSAALAGAKAALEVQEAKLASLKDGTRPEQLAIDQTAVAQAETALTNALQSAYVVADDAIHVKADAVFTSPRTSSATLIIQVPDALLAERVRAERVALEPLLASWQTSSGSTLSSDTAQAVETNLTAVGTFLDDLSTALAKTQPGGSLSAATLAADEAAVNLGRTNVSAALAAVTTADTARKGAEGALALAQAGATQNDINAQQAQVDAAAAAVASAQVALSETALVAPVAGTITVQSAERGETVAPGTLLVSLIADGKFQADALLSDADIAKVTVGDEVVVTSNTYPGVTFPASVTTVNPAATQTSGGVAYGVTVTFAENDPRLSSGLSANLRIITATKEDALSVPTSAVIADGTAFVVFVQGKKGATKTPVAIGIQTADGRTEVTSGLTEGERVLTFGSSAE